MLNLQQTIEQTDSSGFFPITEEIIAGESLQAYGHFRLSQSVDLSGAIPEWKLIDSSGVVYSSGLCSGFNEAPDAFGSSVTLAATISAPSSTPISSVNRSYQLVWQLRFNDSRTPLLFTHSVKVRGLTTSPTGASSSVEMAGDRFTLNLVTPTPFQSVTASLSTSTNQVINPNLVPNPLGGLDVESGRLYSIEINPLNVSVNGQAIEASLDPYILAWRAATGDLSFSVSRYVSEVFVVNPSILSAVEDCRRMVMKARTTAFGFDDLLFTEITILGALRRARDMFNSSSGHLTDFTMTNATGGVREYWLRYAEVGMLSAQALAEGEKSFNYSGQAISLEVDKSQVYQSAADSLQQKIDADVKPFKQNLLKKGITGGDGNLAGVAARGMSSSYVGIGIHGASQFGRAGIFNRSR